MPPPTSATEFAALLERSKLLPPERIEQVVREFHATDEESESATKLAEFLVREKLITEFHAEQLLSGRHRGFVIGGYKILRLIGSGGMGRVYLAEHMIMRRHVALKILPKTKSDDLSALGRFQREARAVAALNHPNIVQAYDIDQDRGLHYMVMEYIDGKNVQEFVKAFGPIPWPLAADYVCQVATGLQHAHESGLVHRDIKPGNVLIEKAGTAKVLDMGLAVFSFEKDIDSLTITYNENVLGTADYLSPEQALDSHNVDIRADIYGLGGTFYFMLAGGTPFPDGTIAQKLLWHQNKDPKPIEAFVPDIPPPVAKILRKMMAKKPANRFSRPIDVAAALKPFAARVNRPFDQAVVGRAVAKAIRNLRKPSDGGPAEGNAARSEPPVADRVDPSPSVSPTTTAINDKGDDSTTKTRRTAAPLQKELPWQNTESTTEPRGEIDPSIDARTGRSAIPTDEGQGSTVQQRSELTDRQAVGDRDESNEGDSAELMSGSDFLHALADSAAAASPSSRKIWSNSEPTKFRRLAMILAVVVITAIAVVSGIRLAQTGFHDSAPISPNPISPQQNPSVEPKRIDQALSDVDETRIVRVKNHHYIEHLQITPEFYSLGVGVTLDGVTLQGESRQGVVVQAQAMPLVTIEDTRNFIVRDLTLDGDGKEGPVVVIGGPGVSGVKFENVTVRNFTGDGIHILDADGLRGPIQLENVRIVPSDASGAAIVIGSSSSTEAAGKSSNVRIIGCEIGGGEAGFGTGIDIRQPIESVMIEMTTFSKGRTGILLSAPKADWKQLRVSENTFEEIEVGGAVANGIDPKVLEKDVTGFRNTPGFPTFPRVDNSTPKTKTKVNAKKK